jgi:phosphatidylglycerol:prolipoprotein diacylglycerol transferase
MFPILYESPGFVLYTQTLFLVIAFIVGILIATHEARQFNLSTFELSRVGLSGFLGGLVGARLLFLLLLGESSVLTLRELCTLGDLDGGFSFHGGLLFGGLAGWFAARYYHLPVWRVGDALAPGLAAALFFMRLGCLFNGCDYGVPTVMIWGITLHGAPRHPIQLYEGIGSLLLLPILLSLNRKSFKPGTTLLWYLFLGGLLRFSVDMFRDDHVRIWQLTIPQYLALMIACAAGALLWSRR